jgi:hypothetical protein
MIDNPPVMRMHKHTEEKGYSYLILCTRYKTSESVFILIRTWQRYLYTMDIIISTTTYYPPMLHTIRPEKITCTWSTLKCQNWTSMHIKLVRLNHVIKVQSIETSSRSKRKIKNREIVLTVQWWWTRHEVKHADSTLSQRKNTPRLCLGLLRVFPQRFDTSPVIVARRTTD